MGCYNTQHGEYPANVNPDNTPVRFNLLYINELVVSDVATCVTDCFQRESGFVFRAFSKGRPAFQRFHQRQRVRMAEAGAGLSHADTLTLMKALEGRTAL